MIIQIDTREKPHAIKKIVTSFDALGVKYVRSKLMVGDYMSFDNPYVIVDRKQSLLEVCNNICQDHDRFRKELMLAYSLDVRMIILVEHGGSIKTLEDVIFWENPRLTESPKALTGEKLYHTMRTIERKYGCVWSFCSKDETGERIIELLKGG